MDLSLSMLHSTAPVAVKSDSGTQVNEICVSEGRRRPGIRHRRRERNDRIVASDTSVDLLTVSSAFLLRFRFSSFFLCNISGSGGGRENLI
jgi:hypothetical protein